jgi:predicted transcriptional regulator
VLQSSQRCYKNRMSATRAQVLLTKRERQIMDVLYRLGRATAAEVMDRLDGSPGYSTVRTQLRVLERKGHVRHEEVGLRYVYMPTLPRHAARRSALKHLVDTFFDGSTAKTVAALLGGEASRVSDEELARIEDLVKNARIQELARNARSDRR